MHWINWTIVVVYLAYVVIDGIRKSKDTDTISGYFAANKSLQPTRYYGVLLKFTGSGKHCCGFRFRASLSAVG